MGGGLLAKQKKLLSIAANHDPMEGRTGLVGCWVKGELHQIFPHTRDISSLQRFGHYNSHHCRPLLPVREEMAPLNVQISKTLETVSNRKKKLQYFLKGTRSGKSMSDKRGYKSSCNEGMCDVRCPSPWAMFLGTLNFTQTAVGGGALIITYSYRT